MEKRKLAYIAGIIVGVGAVAGLISAIKSCNNNVNTADKTNASLAKRQDTLA